MVSGLVEKPRSINSLMTCALKTFNETDFSTYAILPLLLANIYSSCLDYGLSTSSLLQWSNAFEHGVDHLTCFLLGEKFSNICRPGNCSRLQDLLGDHISCPLLEAKARIQRSLLFTGPSGSRRINEFQNLQLQAQIKNSEGHQLYLLRSSFT